MNASLTQHRNTWETKDLWILAAPPSTLTPDATPAGIRGVQTHQVAMPINPSPAVNQSAVQGDHGHPVLVPANDFPLVLLEQMTSLTSCYLTGKLGATWGKGTNPPPSYGFLRGLDEISSGWSLTQCWDRACLLPSALPCSRKGQWETEFTPGSSLVRSCS